MKIWILVLKVFAYIWLTAASLLIFAGIVGTWMNGGFSAVQDLLSPFNIVNVVVTVLTLAPGIGALEWAKRIQSKLVMTTLTQNSNTPLTKKEQVIQTLRTLTPRTRMAVLQAALEAKQEQDATNAPDSTLTQKTSSNPDQSTV